MPLEIEEKMEYTRYNCKYRKDRRNIMIKKTGNKLWRKMIAFTLTAVLIAQCVFCHQNVLADDSVYLEITGYQISTSLEAYRTLYSIADPSSKTEEVGDDDLF